MQQPMINPEDIFDPTTAMNMTLVLIAKAFKLNYLKPTNNNQRISSKPCNRQIAQPGMNLGQDKQMQMGWIKNLNPNKNGNVVAARAEGNTIRINAKEFDFMAAARDIEEAEEVNANCILMTNLLQASTSDTQTDSAPVYDSDGSVEVHHSENCYDNDIFNIVEQDEGIVEQHLATIEETRAYFESLHNNLAIEVEKVNSVNRKMKETNVDLTTELARYKNQEKCFEINQEKYDKIERSSRDSQNCKNDEIFPNRQPSHARNFRNFKNTILKEAAKFVQDFKYLAKEADESLAKHKALEFEIERLLRAVVSQDIMSIVQNNSAVDTSNLQSELDCTKEKLENCIIIKEKEYAVLWNNWYTKCKECKYDKISYDKAYNDMQQKIERLQAQLGDLKGKCKDTPCVSNTLDPLEDKFVPINKVRASVDNAAKTRRPQPKSNTKNDRIPSASKSSCIKNKEVEVEEHHRNLLLSKNKKHMLSECNNVKLVIRNDKSEVVCAMCKQCLITANHDVCVLNYVNGMNSRIKKQKVNVSNAKNKKKQKPKVKKPKKVGSKERLASPTPSEPSICRRWSPTRRIFYCNDKIIKSRASKGQSDNSNGDNACALLSLRTYNKTVFQKFHFFLQVISICFMARRLGFYKTYDLNLKLSPSISSRSFLGTVRFGNDHVSIILGYGDLQWGNILITRVYLLRD
ncbi:hypothetical protein Tco_0683601 [Tanacetum coccineum]